MRLAAAIFATCVSFSAQALEWPAATPADLTRVSVAQLEVGASKPVPVVEAAPLPPIVDRSLATRPAIHQKARHIAQRPGALALRSSPPRRIVARAPILPAPEEALRPAPRRCEVITCPRFVLVGVGF
ncbi:hypothetical protein [Methylosinus sp. Ce-a6]|uniref:hypothetical protein n=1 Tax=Methylosinus sp. Ce-a6 TaxID=2172005 RepID=UPI00135B3E09|nr:hypothetical protein [Methylosinus sp. Ce-a6]